MSERETDPLTLHEHRKVLAQQIAAQIYDVAVAEVLVGEKPSELGAYDWDEITAMVKEKGPAYPPAYQRIAAWKAFGVGA